MFVKGKSTIEKKYTGPLKVSIGMFLSTAHLKLDILKLVNRNVIQKVN